MHFFTLAILCLIVLGVHYGDAFDEYGVQLSSCPLECDCQGLTVDCARRGLTYVPKTMPVEVRRLNLEGNNLTALLVKDFQRLSYLKILHLMDNQISTLEPGLFDELKSLERIRLNRNSLHYLPDNIFIKNTALLRIDLSYNRIFGLTANTLYGLKSLKVLHLDNNQLSCIEDESLNRLKELEILTLNQNNLTSLSQYIFEGLNRLKTLRLGDNPFRCDCNLVWMAPWLRKHSRIVDDVKCMKPDFLYGKRTEDLMQRDFKCNQNGDSLYDAFLQNDGSSYMGTCRTVPQCPFACTCQDGIVDCRNRNLTKIPDFIPENAIELRLEQNSITEVPSRAFSNYRHLGRIDLSKNNISKIAEDAFHGLKSLNTLYLFGNEITDLPEAVFKGLSNIQLLLLNKNRIKCLRRGIFADLKNVNLLSLYDNNIQSLADGIFDSLINIKTLHLGRNPFICDCNLRWLAEYLHDKPELETTEARCEEPKRNYRKRIAQINPDRFRCKGTEELRTKYASQCLANNKCPKNCVCDGTIVDCSRQNLETFPEDVPTFATELRLNDNRIERISSSDYFKRLPNLLKLDLRNNDLAEVEDGALDGAEMLQDLLLSNNRLRQVKPKMFAGLRNLTTLVLQNNLITCVTNDTFAELSTLRFLSLNENKVRCITAGAFEKTKSLIQLNLLNNPLNCNCHLSWMSNWIKKSTIPLGNPRCHTPANLQNVPIEDVEPGDFRCDEDEEETECGPDGLCPARCTCSGNVVRCSKQKLQKFPRYIPATTTELYLDVNEISTIPADLGRLSQLTRIDLSNNQISILPSNIFHNLTTLHTLILSYNKLQCIQQDAFKGLTSLRMLSLHGNDISLIPDGAFSDLNSITHIAIGSNPFYCDCNMRWMAEWIQKNSAEIGIARCHEPKSMRDKLFISALPNHFICAQKTDSQVLAKCDACYTYPCENGGSCISKPMRQYECQCAPGYHGFNCEHKIDACFGNPCDNGGTCKVMEMGRFSCHCQPGFEGLRCETNIDDCADSQCANNSTCVDDIGKYRCECASGFVGEFCEKRIDYCSDDYNPCQNGGQCEEVDNYYHCNCSNGWSGQNCTVNDDDCVLNMCQNGATCVDGIDGYHCECPIGFTGKFCEKVPNVDTLFPQTSPCQHHDCKHGICFLPPGSADYICKCSPGYTGKRCDVLSSISFHNGSYLEFEPLKTKPSVNITFKFVTRKQNGVLLYFGEAQHLAVELFRGRIRISLNVGNYPVSTMFSYEKVSDGVYHEIHFELVRKNFTMRVDGGVARTIVNEGIKEYLEISQSSLYIGGIPDDVAYEAVRNWHIWNATSLEGCMREFLINGDPPDLNMARKQHQVSPGCAEFDQSSNVCANHLCKHGKCVPAVDGQSYECKCKLGYSGPFCDQAPTCQKEIRRDFYYEKSCRSTKKMKLASCIGSCGDSCCRPQKTKKRLIKLACNDGSKYTKQIEIVRKCGCSRKC